MISFEIDFQIDDAIARLTAAEMRMNDNRVFFEQVAEFMHDVTMENFDREGNQVTGSWHELSKARQAQRGSAHPILQDTGALKNSIAPFGRQDEAEVSTQIGYSSLMQFGGVNSNGHMVPQRPYLVIAESDMQNIVFMAESYFFEPFE